ncbi:hypothetical protein CI238_02410 [Colletotrichum incanum]|uniref:2EXR domain-containing protein n=1 Tax=Colletotrichum incanum TaxID=1573173 RepID=A0A166TAF3_COLIC|nr:hypothetical protein CI238_02410 [Colletotrichum incanum]
MATTFRNFSALPPELRLQIWKYALQPSSPGVHFFSLQARPIIPQGLSRRAPTQLHVETKYVLASPTFTGGPPRLWREDNPSMYLVDARLWAAQRESREVAQKNMALRLKSSNAPSGSSSASQLSTEPAQIGWALGVLPHQDHICLQVAPHEYMVVEKALSDLRRIIRNPEIKAGISTPVHIAFEYDESWAIDDRDRASDPTRRLNSRKCFMELLYRVRRGLLRAKLYLIDHQARLLPGSNAPLLFRTDGYEFVHVDRNHVQYGPCNGSTTVWNFIGYLDRLFERWWTPPQVWVPGLSAPPQPYSTQKYVSVLACPKN